MRSRFPATPFLPTARACDFTSRPKACCGSAFQVPLVPGRRYGVEKYSSAGLLVSSAERGWSGLSAELRSHSDGIVAWKSTLPDTEISVDMRGNGSVVTRRGGGIFERTVAERGTIWLSPAGLQEDFLDLSDPVPELLHICLPSCHFSASSLGVEVDKS